MVSQSNSLTLAAGGMCNRVLRLINLSEMNQTRARCSVAWCSVLSTLIKINRVKSPPHICMIGIQGVISSSESNSGLNRRASDVRNVHLPPWATTFAPTRTFHILQDAFRGDARSEHTALQKMHFLGVMFTHHGTILEIMPLQVYVL